MAKFDAAAFMIQTLEDYHSTTENNGRRLGQHIYNSFRFLYPKVEIPVEYECYYNNNKIALFYLYISTLTLS